MKHPALWLVVAIVALAAPAVRSFSPAQDPPPAPCTGRPDPPTDLRVSLDPPLATLTWRAAGHGCAPSTYVMDVWCACFAGGFSELGTDSAATTFVGRNMPSDDYRIRVRGVNGAGKSEPSNEVTFAIPRWGDRSTPDVIVAKSANGRKTFFPTVERLRNGQLVAVYYDSPEHVSPLGRIALVRSADGGRHWSTPRVIADTPSDDRDPSIMQTKDGTLLLSFFAVDRREPPQLTPGVLVSRSTDDGATWSTPVRVASALAGPATSSKIVELDNGDLLLPIYGRPPGADDAHARVMRSTDGGKTWPAVGETEIGAPPGGTDYTEPALVHLGGGRLIVVIRTERGSVMAYASRSEDGGLTWSPLQRLDIIAQASDLLPVRIGSDPRVLVLHSYGELGLAFGDGRRTMMELVDPDAGREHSVPTVVYHGHCSWGDESYPSTVRISDTQLFTVYYDACAGIIGGTYSSLSELARTR